MCGGQGAVGQLPMPLMIGGVIGGFVVAMVTVFKQTWAPYTTPLYAALEGLALGGISYLFEQSYPGIVAQAVFLTFGTLGALLFAYRSGIIRATENFKLGVFAATGGIAIVYLLSFVLGFFGIGVPLIHSSGTFGILFSLFVVVIAALNLVLDFDFIEEGAERGAPEVHGVVRRIRAAGDTGLALSGDSAAAGQATGSTVSARLSRTPKIDRRACGTRLLVGGADAFSE